MSQLLRRGIISSNFTALFLAVIYGGLLFLGYKYDVQIDSFGFQAITTPHLVRFFSWVYVLLPVLFMPKRVKGALDFSLWSWYLVAYVPIILFSFAWVRLPVGQEISCLTATFLCFLLLIIMLRTSFNLRIIPNFCLQLSRRQVLWLLALISALVVVSFVLKYHSEMRWSALSNIYKQRALFSTYTPNGSVFAYIQTFSMGVLLPLICLLAFEFRNYIFYILGGLLAVCLFMMAANKSPLGTLVLSPGLYFFLRYFFRKRDMFPIAKFLFAVVLLVLIILIFAQFLGVSTPYAMAVRRSILVHGAVSGMYFGFFSLHPHVYFSYGSIGHFSPASYPYSIGYTHLPTQYYYQDPFDEANTNYLLDAFAQAGFLGMFAMTVVFGLYLKFLGRFMVAYSKAFSCALMFFVVSMATSSALTTVLVSYGFILLPFILVAIRGGGD